MDTSESDKTSLSAVILDLDGLVLDTERVARRAWRRAAAELGYAIDDSLHARIIGRTLRDSRRILVEALGPRFPYVRARQLQQHYVLQVIDEDGLAQKPGLCDLLRTAKDLSLHVALATSSHRDSVQRKLSAASLDGVFPTMICGDEVTNGKPAPDLFLEAATRLGVAPSGCVVLEDSHAGARAAHAAGMRPILIPDLVPASQEIEALCWAILPSLDAAARFLTSACAEDSRTL